MATAIFKKAQADIRASVIASLKGLVDYFCESPEHLAALYSETVNDLICLNKLNHLDN